MGKFLVENVYGCTTEIGSVEKCSRAVAADSKSFIDSSRRLIHYQNTSGQVDVGVPARDSAIFSVKDENARTGLPCLDTTKPLVLLKTTPFGVAVVPAGLPGGGGIVTTHGELGGNGLPFPL